MRRRPCPQCGYDLTGQLTGAGPDDDARVIRCPECGTSQRLSRLHLLWSRKALPPVARAHRRAAEATTLLVIIAIPILIAARYISPFGLAVTSILMTLMIIIGIVGPSRRDDGTISGRRCRVAMMLIILYLGLVLLSMAALIGMLFILLICGAMLGIAWWGIPAGIGAGLGLCVIVVLLIAVFRPMIRLERRLCMSCELEQTTSDQS